MSWNENDLLFGANKQYAKFKRLAKIKRVHARQLRKAALAERIRMENAIDELDGLLDVA